MVEDNKKKKGKTFVKPYERKNKKSSGTHKVSGHTRKTSKKREESKPEAERQEMEDEGFGRIKVKMSIQSIETCIEEDNIGQAISHTEQLKERLKEIED